jgi:predicted acetyltransferase
MRSGGYHFVLLYTGVNPFYEPLGWGTLDLPICYLPLASTPTLGAGRCEVERPPIFEAPAEILSIYADSCGRHPLALQRTPEYWRSWPHWAKDNLWFGLLDNRWTVARKDGRVVAYGGLHWSLDREGSQSIREAGALPGHEDALLDVFDDLVSRARAVSERGAPLELNLPSNHPYLRKCAHRCEHARSTRMMAQILDLRGLLEALVPELRSRAVALPRPVTITLVSSPHGATVAAAPGEVSVSDSGEGDVAQLTPAGLASLVLGYRSATDLAASGELQAVNLDLVVLDILFPCLHSHYWQLDHF